MKTPGCRLCAEIEAMTERQYISAFVMGSKVAEYMKRRHTRGWEGTVAYYRAHPLARTAFEGAPDEDRPEDRPEPS
jgi:hypothetical protein